MYINKTKKGKCYIYCYVEHDGLRFCYYYAHACHVRLSLNVNRHVCLNLVVLY